MRAVTERLFLSLLDIPVLYFGISFCSELCGFASENGMYNHSSSLGNVPIKNEHSAK